MEAGSSGSPPHKRLNRRGPRRQNLRQRLSRSQVERNIKERMLHSPNKRKRMCQLVPIRLPLCLLFFLIDLSTKEMMMMVGSWTKKSRNIDDISSIFRVSDIPDTIFAIEIRLLE